MTSIQLSTWLSIYSSIYLSMHLSFDLSIYRPAYRSDDLSIVVYSTLSISLSSSIDQFSLSLLSVSVSLSFFICLSTYMYPSIYLSGYVLTGRRMSLPVCVFVGVSTYLSIYLSVCLSVWLSVCLFVCFFLPMPYVRMCLFHVLKYACMNVFTCIYAYTH